jgi:hypothetical protein
MESGRRIGEDLIKEVLATIFVKEEKHNKTPSNIKYNHPHFAINQPSILPTERSILNYSNSRNNRAYILGKIKGLREGNHCHWCGEVGHIKNTCFKKQAFDNTKGKTSEPPQIPKHTQQVHIPYDIGFDIIVKKLNLLGGPHIPLDELLQLRTTINTLIYTHPSQREANKFNPKLY